MSDLSVAGTRHYGVRNTLQHKYTHTKHAWRQDQWAPCQWGGINGFICVCIFVCVCGGMYMLLSANSSSAACPTPYKEQTLCLLKESDTFFFFFFLIPENWLCFPNSVIKLWHDREFDRKQLWYFTHFISLYRLSLNYHSYVTNTSISRKKKREVSAILSLVIQKEKTENLCDCQPCSVMVACVYGK